jgi:hypothetical protein
MSATWVVLPHGSIEKISPRLWRVEGSLDGGPPLKRIMVVAQRANGGLVIHSAIALEEKAMKEIEAWGPIEWIVVPNGFHRMDAQRFADRYPNAKVICPSGARKKVEAKVKVHGTFADFVPDEHISLLTMRGCAESEGAMSIKDTDGTTLVFNDVIFNMPHAGGFGGFVLRYLTDSSGGPKVSRIARLFVVKDKKAAADHLRELADTPRLTRVMVAHHETIDTDPSTVLRGLADTLA